MTRKTIKKYLAFLVDYSERLASEHNLDKAELQSLQLEFDRFVAQLKGAKNVDPSFFQKLSEIQFNPSKNVRRPTGDKLLRIVSFLVAFRFEGMFAREEMRKTDIRDTVKEFRDRISHLLFGINTFKLPD